MELRELKHASTSRTALPLLTRQVPCVFSCGRATSLRNLLQTCRHLGNRSRSCRARHSPQAGLVDILNSNLTPIVTSTVIAGSTVLLNLAAGIVTEKKRAELTLEVERQKAFQKAQQDLQSLTARYRGPLLEACVDLEHRLWHLANATSEWRLASGEVNDEEVLFTLFNLSQFLGYVEVVRREGPREDAFLQAGNPQGSDTLATLIEGLRFVQASATGNLVDWGDVEDSVRDHPGARSRRSGDELIDWTPIQAKDIKADDLLRCSRGAQRAIGSQVIYTTDGGVIWHTLSYNEFVVKYRNDPGFAEWLNGMHDDLTRLVEGDPWKGQGPFPIMRWSRVLLMQQLLIDAMDLLDPECVRVPKARRSRLMPIEYGPLPALSEYQRKLRRLARSQTFVEYSGALRDVGSWVRSVSSMDEAQLDPLKRKATASRDDAARQSSERPGNGMPKARPPRHSPEGQRALKHATRKNLSVQGPVNFRDE